MKLSVIGCLHTWYVWSSMGRYPAQEYDEYENWGLCGIGNFAIFQMY